MKNKACVEIYHNILWSKYKGGVFSRLHELCSEQSSDLDVKFVQIAETEGDRIGLSGVDMSYHTYPHALLFRGSYENVPLFGLCAALAKKVFSSKADLIVIPGYHRPEYWVMLMVAALFGKKRAVFCDSTVHDRPHSLVNSALKRLFFSLCNGFFGYGVRSREYLISLGAAPDSIFYRCQAAALPHDYSKEEALSKRVRAVEGLESPRFLYVGRLSWEKSLDVLIRSFLAVRDRLPGSELVLVGAGPDLEKLRVMVRELGLEGSVRFAGSKDVSELSEEYGCATCLVLPSRSEPWGLVVNEALSYGCPVVVSNNCGCSPELVVEGVTGHAFKTDDEADLADKLCLIVSNFGEYERVARRCIDHISRFSPQNAARQIYDGSLKIIG